jgi:hypothetical protein
MGMPRVMPGGELVVHWPSCHLCRICISVEMFFAT